MIETVTITIPMEHLRPLRDLLDHAEVRLDWLMHDRDRPYCTPDQAALQHKNMDSLYDLKNSVQDAINEAISAGKLKNETL